jgi:hypothetical protein
MRTLGQSRRILVAAPALATSIGNAAIADLANWPTLSSTNELGEMDWDLIGPNDARHSVRHQPRMTCGDFDALRDAAAGASAWRYCLIMSAATICAPAASSASSPAGAARWASCTSSSPPAEGYRLPCGRLSTM